MLFTGQAFRGGNLIRKTVTCLWQRRLRVPETTATWCTIAIALGCEASSCALSCAGTQSLDAFSLCTIPNHQKINGDAQISVLLCQTSATALENALGKRGSTICSHNAWWAVSIQFSVISVEASFLSPSFCSCFCLLILKVLSLYQ